MSASPADAVRGTRVSTRATTPRPRPTADGRTEAYDPSDFAPRSRGGRGVCSHPRCKEEPAATLTTVRDTGTPVRRALCAEHLPAGAGLRLAG